MNKLYRYRPPVLQYLNSEIEEGKIWLCAQPNQNDPFEGRVFRIQEYDPDKIVAFIQRVRTPPEFDFGKDYKYTEDGGPFTREYVAGIRELKNKSPDELRKNILFASKHKHLMERNLSIINEHIERMRSKTIFCCFSEIKNSSVMMSHYGVNHTGVCLEYEVDLQKYSTEIKKVKYVDSIPVIDHCGWKDEELFEKYIFTKSIEWEYEQEWRYFHYPSDSMHGKFKLGRISKIFCGWKASESLKKAVLRMANNSVFGKIPVFDLVPDTQKYTYLEEVV